MINKGITIDTERGRIRIARYLDDYLGNPEYLAFIADDDVLCLCEGDDSFNGWGRVRRGNSIDINCKPIVDWMIKGYGLDHKGKLTFSVADIGGSHKIPYVNINIGLPFEEPELK